jgi:hypothetical protein
MANNDDLIRRAWAKLTAVRSDLRERGYVQQKSYFQTFDEALTLLEQAGATVSEWRWPYSSVGSIDAGEFRARIDEILLYFEVKDTQIGFRR